MTRIVEPFRDLAELLLGDPEAGPALPPLVPLLQASEMCVWLTIVLTLPCV